ncbi:MAG: hypothetical protein ABI851_02135 [Saprospiraceae bacterium]
MIERDHYLEIAEKYGHHSSWAIWADVGDKPKSNINDMRIFDFEHNPTLLMQLNPNIVMVGLNFSRKIENQLFVNFHDRNPHAQDYKIRHAFKGTAYYGAYMTDIIKDFEQLISGEVVSYLKTNKYFEEKNINLFKQELKDLKVDAPLILAFGSATNDILTKYFGKEYKILKIPHYSMHINKEIYKELVASIINQKLGKYK